MTSCWVFTHTPMTHPHIQICNFCVSKQNWNSRCWWQWKHLLVFVTMTLSIALYSQWWGHGWHGCCLMLTITYYPVVSKTAQKAMYSVCGLICPGEVQWLKAAEEVQVAGLFWSTCYDVQQSEATSQSQFHDQISSPDVCLPIRWFTYLPSHLKGQQNLTWYEVKQNINRRFCQ